MERKTYNELIAEWKMLRLESDKVCDEMLMSPSAGVQNLFDELGKINERRKEVWAEIRAFKHEGILRII